MQWLKPCCVDGKTVILLQAWLGCLWLNMKVDIFPSDMEEQAECVKPWAHLPQRAPRGTSITGSPVAQTWSEAAGPQGLTGQREASQWCLGGEQKGAAGGSQGNLTNTCFCLPNQGTEVMTDVIETLTI